MTQASTSRARPRRRSRALPAAAAGAVLRRRRRPPASRSPPRRPCRRRARQSPVPADRRAPSPSRCCWASLWWLSGGRYVSTDNAYVGADKALITPYVTGPIVADPRQGRPEGQGRRSAVRHRPGALRDRARARAGPARRGEGRVRQSARRPTPATKTRSRWASRPSICVRPISTASTRWSTTHGRHARRTTTRPRRALVQAKQILEFVREQQDADQGQARRRARRVDRDLPRLHPGQGAGRRRRAQPRLYERQGADRRRRDAGRADRARPRRARRPAGVRGRRRQGALGRRQSEGIRPDLCHAGPAGERDRRHVPRPRMARQRLLDRARHRRAIRDPAAAERERQLGQGRAARSAALLLRPRPGHDGLARGHERDRLDRHRPHAQPERALRAASSAGRVVVEPRAGADEAASRRDERRSTATIAPLERVAADGLRDDGDHHAGARHDDRQRRPALYAGLALDDAGPGQLGADLLYRRRRDHDLAARLVRDALRPQEAVHRLRRRLHRRLDAVRHRAERSSRWSRSGCCRACSAPRWCR